MPTTTNPNAILPAEARVSRGTLPGWVEIAFSMKPPASETEALKRAGFKFTTRAIDTFRLVGRDIAVRMHTGPRWYGQAAKAPQAYRAAVAALLDDPCLAHLTPVLDGADLAALVNC